MDRLLDNGAKIQLCATDRHIQIQKLHREKYLPKNIAHEFDVYHLANTIQKELKAKTSKKKFSSLHKWERSVINHSWWAAATCDGNADILVEKWLSITEHVVDNHEFPGNQLFTACDQNINEQLLERETEPSTAKRTRGEDEETIKTRKKKWLKKTLMLTEPYAPLFIIQDL